MSKEQDRLIEALAKAMYYQHVSAGFEWENEGKWYKDKYRGFAAEIVEHTIIKHCYLKDDNQTRPEIGSLRSDAITQHEQCKIIQHEMIAHRWRKVIEIKV